MRESIVLDDLQAEVAADGRLKLVVVPVTTAYGRRRVHPYQTGNVVWVREAFCVVDDREYFGTRWVDYRATPRYSLLHPGGRRGSPHNPDALKWRSATRMPKWASRTNLRVSSVACRRAPFVWCWVLEVEKVEVGR